MDKPRVYQYAKNTLKGYYNCPWVKSLLKGLYTVSRIPPIDFVPLKTRQRAIRLRHRYGAFGIINIGVITGTINIGAITGAVNMGAITGIVNTGAVTRTVNIEAIAA